MLSESERQSYEQTKYFATASQRREAEIERLKTEALARERQYAELAAAWNALK